MGDDRMIDRQSGDLPTFDGGQGMSDEELTSLFSEFDRVQASDDLKASTLALLLDEPAAQDAEGSEATAPVETVRASSPERGRRGVRSKLRVIRIAAVAACLTLALSGGIAYAVPVSHVTVSRGDASVELGVNCFGVTVGASASEGAQVDVADMSFKPYGEVLPRVADELAKVAPDAPARIEVASDDDARRQRLEAESAEMLGERVQGAEIERPEQAGGAAAPDGGIAPDDAAGTGALDSPDGTGESAQPSQPTQPSQPEQPGQLEQPGQVGQSGEPNSPETPDFTQAPEAGQPAGNGAPGGSR